MKNLISFILRHSSWLVAILLVAFSFYLVFTQNAYQRSVYLTSANNVSGWFSETSDKLTIFFNLNRTNKELVVRNTELVNELQKLKSFIEGMQTDSTKTNAFAGDSTHMPQFSFIPANVTNISFSGPNNFITVNKGLSDGVKPDMGVVSQNGVVGVVLTVSENYSLIIPIINPKFRVSAKLKGTENTGSISWNGNKLSIAQLSELPKHQVFQKGDTVLTSFSRIFPKDIVIGFVREQVSSKDDNFNTLNISLATDFSSLQSVWIIDDKYYPEQKQLERTLQQ